MLSTLKPCFNGDLVHAIFADPYVARWVTEPFPLQGIDLAANQHLVKAYVAYDEDAPIGAFTFYRLTTYVWMCQAGFLKHGLGKPARDAAYLAKLAIFGAVPEILKLMFWVEEGNKPSLRFCQDVGAKIEGKLMHNSFRCGKLVNVISLAILRADI